MISNIDKAIPVLVRRAESLVDELIKMRGHDKPPFLGEEYAPLVGVKRIERVAIGEASGFLVRAREGLVIKLNSSQLYTRQNYSCAHEVGHVLLSQLKLDSLIEDVECRTFNPQTKDMARAKAYERLCDIAARELIMPGRVFRRVLADLGMSVRSLEQLARAFRVSIRAAALRIPEVSQERCLALLWQPWPNAKSPRVYRLAWCGGPLTDNMNGTRCAPLCNYASKQSTIHDAFMGNSYTKCYRSYTIGGEAAHLRTESKAFGYGANRYIVSVAFEGGKHKTASSH